MGTVVINTNGVQESIVCWKFKLTVMTGFLHTSVTVARTLDIFKKLGKNIQIPAGNDQRSFEAMQVDKWECWSISRYFTGNKLPRRRLCCENTIISI